MKVPLVHIIEWWLGGLVAFLIFIVIWEMGVKWLVSSPPLWQKLLVAGLLSVAYTVSQISQIDRNPR